MLWSFCVRDAHSLSATVHGQWAPAEPWYQTDTLCVFPITPPEGCRVTFDIKESVSEPSYYRDSDPHFISDRNKFLPPDYHFHFLLIPAFSSVLGDIFKQKHSALTLCNRNISDSQSIGGDPPGVHKNILTGGLRWFNLNIQMCCFIFESLDGGFMWLRMKCLFI